jgi:hypothetical protein
MSCLRFINLEFPVICNDLPYTVAVTTKQKAVFTEFSVKTKLLTLNVGYAFNREISVVDDGDDDDVCSNFN